MGEPSEEPSFSSRPARQARHAHVALDHMEQLPLLSLREGDDPRVWPGAQPVLQQAVRLVAPLTSARRASILLVAEDGGLWVYASDGTRTLSRCRADLDEGIAAEVLRTGLPLLIRDVRESPFPVRLDRGYSSRSCMVAPVAWEHRLYGLVCATDPAAAEAFASENLAALQMLAQHLAACLNALVVAGTGPDLDGMTGLQNSRAFEEHLNVESERSMRFGHRLSLLLLEIDYLEELRERPRGAERVLRQIAQCALDTVRRVDVVARLSDNEFVVLLPETGAAASLNVGRRLARRLQRLLGLPESASPTVRVLMGISTLPPASSPVELMEHARQALQQSRLTGEPLHHWKLGGPDAMVN